MWGARRCRRLAAMAKNRPLLSAVARPCATARGLLLREGFAFSTLTPGTVVTSFGVNAGPNAQLRPRLVRRDGGGPFTAVASGAPVTGSAAGGVQSFRTHMVAPAGEVTLALDLGAEGGGIAVVPEEGYDAQRLAPVLGTARRAPARGCPAS